MEPIRYDPIALLPDPRLRALAGKLDPVARAVLAELLAGNMSTHIVYCVRAGAVPVADPMAADAVPIARELAAEELARAITPEGTIGMVFDGLRVPVPLPPLAAAILRLIDGRRSVGDIAAALAESGTDAASFARAWRETWDKLSALNRILLAAPA